MKQKVLAVIYILMLCIATGCDTAEVLPVETTTRSSQSAQGATPATTRQSAFKKYEINGISLGDKYAELEKQISNEWNNITGEVHEDYGTTYSYKNINISFFQSEDLILKEKGFVKDIAVLSGNYLGFELSKSTIQDVTDRFGQPRSIASAKYDYISGGEDYDPKIYMRYSYGMQGFELHFYFEKDILTEIVLWGYPDEILAAE